MDLMTSGNRNNAALGARLQGVQHFGLTVQNMDRAFEFYTEVLGGSEVMRDGDFQGEKIHNTLMTDQEIVARERKARTSRAASSAWTFVSYSSTMSLLSSCNIATRSSRWEAETAGPSRETT
jgi:hypothetical protein